MATHTFEIKAGELEYEGDISCSESGKLSYSEDQPEELSEKLDTDFKRILELLEGFIDHYGTLEKFEITEVE